MPTVYTLRKSGGNLELKNIGSGIQNFMGVIFTDMQK
jgi:hypothetical protein